MKMHFGAVQCMKAVEIASIRQACDAEAWVWGGRRYLVVDYTCAADVMHLSNKTTSGVEGRG